MTLIVVALLVSWAGLDMARGEDAVNVLHVRSAYRPIRVLAGHQIELEAELGGKGTLSIDPNTCRLDVYGDPKACTRMAIRRMPVTLAKEDHEDPTGAKRTRYKLSMKGLAESTKLFLVVPGTSGAYRLVIEEGDKRTPVTLELVPAKPAPK